MKSKVVYRKGSKVFMLIATCSGNNFKIYK